ncbi:hypothetical protein SAMN05661086_01122 [Anaeromicropila populeti]|uniref:Uncharacterized protein n=1 Tax=Anaeromicropila populeti TaxID=37658 RepID=A0A1I6IS98_9FIRM|nr:hypothetical protein SAMN05661086_01122 [Anaeromicropila populeti]
MIPKLKSLICSFWLIIENACIWFTLAFFCLHLESNLTRYCCIFIMLLIISSMCARISKHKIIHKKSSYVLHMLLSFVVFLVLFYYITYKNIFKLIISF